MKSQQRPYSQSKALWAITRASFKATFSNPSAIIFSILFPIIFTLIFGAFGNNGGPSYRIALTPGSDTSQGFYTGLKKIPGVKIIRYPNTFFSRNKDLYKGHLTAILDIKSQMDSSDRPTLFNRHQVYNSQCKYGLFIPGSFGPCKTATGKNDERGC